ncbi:unnamed protein product [Parnassius apollo]|uniref:(apollo) hypothetical protein n=1 Tax=Parnassius apollo TaxID=110799 RepID=A0A8S3Y5P1_PARAO|nr:unnamed protein product [Parnassius apollo]
MSRNILDDHRIQEILEEDGIEGEVSSEIEDKLEIDDDDSNSSQSGDDDNSEAEDFSAGNISAEMLHRRPDLSDVPLSYFRQGYYVGRNGSTNWSIEEPLEMFVLVATTLYFMRRDRLMRQKMHLRLWTAGVLCSLTVF